MEYFVGALALLAIFIAFSAITVVRQGYMYTIERFGRFPHRNAVLGRTSTAEEIEFLKQPGSSF